MVGLVMFPIIEIRPDIAFAVLTVSRFAYNPTSTHITAVRLILQYLAGSLNRGITYGGDENLDLTLIGFSDADWGQDKTTRRSVSGFVFMLNGGLISWKLKLQATVSLSTC